MFVGHQVKSEKGHQVKSKKTMVNILLISTWMDLNQILLKYFSNIFRSRLNISHKVKSKKILSL